MNRKMSITSILDLDDDVLSIIFEHLNMRDTITFACVHDRLRDVFQERNRKKFEHLTICGTEFIIEEVSDDNLTMMAIGGIVRRVSIFKKEFNVFKPLLQSMERLESMEYCGPKLVEDDFVALGALPMLASLKIWNCQVFEGIHLKNLKHLTVLELTSCVFSTEKDFDDMCQTLVNLKELRLRECKWLYSQGFNTIATLCTNLEKITLSIIDIDLQYSCLAQLGNLKHIAIKDANEEAIMKLLGELAEHRAEQLQSLNLVTNISPKHIEKIICLKMLTCLSLRTSLGDLTDASFIQLRELKNLRELEIPHERHITRDAIMKVICRCEHLKKLDVSHCEGLCRKFAMNVIALLTNRNKPEDEPLTIITMLTKTNACFFHSKTGPHLRFVHSG